VTTGSFLLKTETLKAASAPAAASRLMLDASSPGRSAPLARSSRVGLAIAIAGVLAFVRLPIDAFPDTTPVQVQVNTVAPALSPLEIERQITAPVEQALSGLPGLKEVRSLSRFGLSQVTLIFEDGTDIYLARQVVSERLQAVELPPASSARSWARRDRPRRGVPLPRHRRRRPWPSCARPGLDRSAAARSRARRRRGQRLGRRRAPGPGRRRSDRAHARGLTLAELVRGARANNANVGGGTLDAPARRRWSRASASLTRLERRRGRGRRARRVPIRVRDVANVVEGARSGAARSPPTAGRGRARPRLHADGREQPRRHEPPRGCARRRSGRRCRPASTVEVGLRAHHARRRVLDTVARTSSRARCSSSPCCSCSSATCARG
jgi:hypothetical protein